MQLAAIRVTLCPVYSTLNCQQLLSSGSRPSWLTQHLIYLFIFKRAGLQIAVTASPNALHFSHFWKIRTEAGREPGGRQMRGNELADESDVEPRVQRRGRERREWSERKMTLIKVVCHSQASGLQRRSSRQRGGFAPHLSTGSERAQISICEPVPGVVFPSFLFSNIQRVNVSIRRGAVLVA